MRSVHGARDAVANLPQFLGIESKHRKCTSWSTVVLAEKRCDLGKSGMAGRAEVARPATRDHQGAVLYGELERWEPPTERVDENSTTWLLAVVQPRMCSLCWELTVGIDEFEESEQECLIRWILHRSGERLA